MALVQSALLAHERGRQRLPPSNAAQSNKKRPVHCALLVQVGMHQGDSPTREPHVVPAAQRPPSAQLVVHTLLSNALPASTWQLRPVTHGMSRQGSPSVLGPAPASPPLAAVQLSASHWHADSATAHSTSVTRMARTVPRSRWARN
jgi:hypothetical protein